MEFCEAILCTINKGPKGQKLKAVGRGLGCALLSVGLGNTEAPCTVVLKANRPTVAALDIIEISKYCCPTEKRFMQQQSASELYSRRDVCTTV